MSKPKATFTPATVSHAEAKGFAKVDWAFVLDREYKKLIAQRKGQKLEVDFFVGELRAEVSDYSTCAVGQLDSRIPRKVGDERGRDCIPVDHDLYHLGFNFYALTAGGLETHAINGRPCKCIYELTVRERYKEAKQTLKEIKLREKAVLKELGY